MAVRPPLRLAHTSTPGGFALASIYGLENLSRATIAPVIALAGIDILKSAQNLSSCPVCCLTCIIGFNAFIRFFDQTNVA